MKSKHPERLCLGCRKRAAKIELVRFVHQDGTLLVDEMQREPGRGVYCHPTVSCWHETRFRAKWERALRLEQGSLKEKDFVEFLNRVRTQFEKHEGTSTTLRKQGSIRL